MTEETRSQEIDSAKAMLRKHGYTVGIMKKKFVCVWGEWDSKAKCCYDNCTEIHDESFFSAAVGYEYDDIEKVKALEVGETYMSEYGNHIVTRVS